MNIISVSVIALFACAATVAARCEPGAAETYYVPDGRDYRGTVNKTISGIECQRWDVQEPHEHHIQLSAAQGIGSHNYCRNPFGATATGCYTVDPRLRFELCDVGPPCSSQYISSKVRLHVSPSSPTVVVKDAVVDLRCEPSGCRIAYSLETDASAQTSLKTYSGPVRLTAAGRYQLTAEASAIVDGELQKTRVVKSFTVVAPSVDPVIRIAPDPAIKYERAVLVNITSNSYGETQFCIVTGDSSDSCTFSPYSGPFWLARSADVIVQVVSSGVQIASQRVHYDVTSEADGTIALFPSAGTFIGKTRVLIVASAHAQLFLSLNGGSYNLLQQPFFVLPSRPEPYKVAIIATTDQSRPVTLETTFTVEPLLPPKCTPGSGEFHGPVNVVCSAVSMAPNVSLPLPSVTVDGVAAVSNSVSLDKLGNFNVAASVSSSAGETATATFTYSMTSSALVAPKPFSNCNGKFVAPFACTLDMPSASVVVADSDAVETQNASVSSGVTNAQVTVNVRSSPREASVFALASVPTPISFTVYPAGTSATQFFGCTWRCQEGGDECESSFKRYLATVLSLGDESNIELASTEPLIVFRIVGLAPITVDSYESSIMRYSVAKSDDRLSGLKWERGTANDALVALILATAPKQQLVASNADVKITFSGPNAKSANGLCKVVPAGASCETFSIDETMSNGECDVKLTRSGVFDVCADATGQGFVRIPVAQTGSLEVGGRFSNAAAVVPDGGVHFIGDSDSLNIKCTKCSSMTLNGSVSAQNTATLPIGRTIVNLLTHPAVGSVEALVRVVVFDVRRGEEPVLAGDFQYTYQVSDAVEIAVTSVGKQPIPTDAVRSVSLTRDFKCQNASEVVGTGSAVSLEAKTWKSTLGLPLITRGETEFFVCLNGRLPVALADGALRLNGWATGVGFCNATEETKCSEACSTPLGVESSCVCTSENALVKCDAAPKPPTVARDDSTARTLSLLVVGAFVALWFVTAVTLEKNREDFVDSK